MADLTEAQIVEAVWKKEEGIWQAMTTSDSSAVMACYAKEFIGWPDGYVAPINRAQAEASLLDLFKVKKLIFWKMSNRMGCLNGDSTVTLFYYVSTVWKALEEKPDQINVSASTERYSHYWILNDGQWECIGGLTAAATSGSGILTTGG